MKSDRSTGHRFNGHLLVREKWKKPPITVKQILPGMSMGFVVGLIVIIYFW